VLLEDASADKEEHSGTLGWRPSYRARLCGREELKGGRPPRTLGMGPLGTDCPLCGGGVVLVSLWHRHWASVARRYRATLAMLHGHNLRWGVLCNIDGSGVSRRARATLMVVTRRRRIDRSFMASNLRIPSRYIAGMRAVGELRLEDVRAICDALAPVPDRLSTPRLVERIKGAVPHLGDDVAEEMLEAIMSLGPLVAEDEDDGWLSGLIASEIAASDDLALTESERPKFAERLGALLRLEALRLASRAHGLITENERVFHDVRIMTDLRPVFSADPQKGPLAATVVATMRIDYHPGGERGTEATFFSLDRSDLSSLREHVDRAIAETDALMALAISTKLPYWEYDESDAADH
jgi:hypothetical protein